MADIHLLNDCNAAVHRIAQLAGRDGLTNDEQAKSAQAADLLRQVEQSVRARRDQAQSQSG